MSDEVLNQILTKMVEAAKAAQEIGRDMKDEKNQLYWQGRAAGLMDANAMLKQEMERRDR